MLLVKGDGFDQSRLGYRSFPHRNCLLCSLQSKWLFFGLHSIMSDRKVHFGSGGVRALEISNFLFAPPLTSPEYTLNILS